MAYKTHRSVRCTPFPAGQIKKKQSTNIKRNEIIIMNIINDNTFNLPDSLLNDNGYMKGTPSLS